MIRYRKLFLILIVSIFMPTLWTRALKGKRLKTYKFKGVQEAGKLYHTAPLNSNINPCLIFKQLASKMAIF